MMGHGNGVNGNRDRPTISALSLKRKPEQQTQHWLWLHSASLFRMGTWMDLPTKRKRTINPKLLNNDNMSSDAVKRQKLEALKLNQTLGPLASSSQSIAATTSLTDTGAHLSLIAPSASSTSAPSTCQASIKIIDNDTDHFHPNEETPKNLDAILESIHDNDDTDFTPLVARKQEAKNKQTEVVDKSSDKVPSKKETNDEELGKLNLLLPYKASNLFSRTSAKRLAVQNICVL